MKNLIEAPDIAARIEIQAKANKTTVNKVLKACGLGTSYLCDMKSKKSYPTVDKLSKIALNLEVTTDYLIGLTDDPSSHSENIDIDDYFSFISQNYWKLNKKGKEFAFETFQNIVENDKYIIEREISQGSNSTKKRVK